MIKGARPPEHIEEEINPLDTAFYNDESDSSDSRRSCSEVPSLAFSSIPSDSSPPFKRSRADCDFDDSEVLPDQGIKKRLRSFRKKEEKKRIREQDSFQQQLSRVDAKQGKNLTEWIKLMDTAAHPQGCAPCPGCSGCPSCPL